MTYRFFLPVMILSLALGACGGTAKEASGSPAEAPAATALSAPAAGDQVFEISVTSAGFVPAKLQASMGRPVKLVVTRKTDQTCATEIVIKEYGINQKLPLNQPVEVVFTPTRPGKVRFACGMDMVAGEIEVK